MHAALRSSPPTLLNLVRSQPVHSKTSALKAAAHWDQEAGMSYKRDLRELVCLLDFGLVPHTPVPRLRARSRAVCSLQ